MSIGPKNFHLRLLDAREEAVGYILSVVKKRGSDYQLVDPDLLEDNPIGNEEVCELPRGFTVGKYWSYTEYPIVSIDIEDGVLSFNGLAGLCENDNDYIFTEEELSSETLCLIADLVYQLEN